MTVQKINEEPAAKIEKESAIRKKIGKSVKLEEIFTPEKIRECQSIIEKAHEGFHKDILDIWQFIINDFSEFTKNPKQGSTLITQINKNAFLIKGKLDAVGYNLGHN